jgi:2-polyprenyl-6-methoxyphenol hydroxylase-like FAD-dependent oxidoreductase
MVPQTGVNAMTATLVGLKGPLAGKSMPIGSHRITFGRSPENDVVLSSSSASRLHAEVRCEGGNYFLYDLSSYNRTLVNGSPVTVHQLQPGDHIVLGEQAFRFETSDTSTPTTVPIPGHDTHVTPPPVLRVTISGGGPVGLSLALLLEHLMGPRAAITVYDGRWTKEDGQVVWKSPSQGNVRRQQVVTIQSRQYLKLPREVQDRLFSPGAYSEMWPKGPDSIQDLGPRNIRIAYVEDQLLAIANAKSDHIQLVPAVFNPATAHDELVERHVLAICEGSRSATREHFAAAFGAADVSMYALDGAQVQDMVLGLRVKSDLPDSTAVLLTVAQNRFLLNSLRGEGFLNMRLTDQEAKEAVGIDPVRQAFTACIQSEPCLLERAEGSEFLCGMHHAFFLPALLKGSALWGRVHAGLQLFGIREENLTAVTGFRLDMVQRPRFTAQLFPTTASTPGTFGFLVGDAANAIHFWPGRGLNSGLASVISLARCLAATWRGRTLRDADFLRHEAVMAMLQYRHKSRAWRQMVTTDAAGTVRTIKDLIEQGLVEGDQGAYDREADSRALLERLVQIRGRLEQRVSGLPDDATLRAHLQQQAGQTLHMLLASGVWDTVSVGGEEVDLEVLFAQPDAPVAAGAELQPVAGLTLAG